MYPCPVVILTWCTFCRRPGEQAGVEACLILGELKMGTDALLAAILSGVLRPGAQPKGFGYAAVTAADIEEVGAVPRVRVGRTATPPTAFHIIDLRSQRRLVPLVR